MKSYQAISSLHGTGIWRHARRCLITSIASTVIFAALSSSSFAIPDTDPDDPGPIVMKVSGALTFRGCQPSANDVTVRIANPARSGHPSNPVRLADGSLRMSYSIAIGNDTDPNLPDQVVVTPQVSSSVCGAGSFTPGSRTVATGATGVNFDYQVAATGQFTIPMDTFVLFANSFLSGVRLHLNNDHGQNSFVTLGTVTTAFDIAPEKKDLPFPLPGSASFFVRDMNLTSANLSRSSTGLNLKLRFEENGIEVKGYHSTLGDIGMTDFQMRNIVLNLTAGLRVKNAKLAMGFSSPRLEASTTSTGGCNIFGLDWCNLLFGTNGKLKKSFELTAFTQLNSATIQTTLTNKIMEGLAQRGITGRIGTVTVQGDFIVITTI